MIELCDIVEIDAPPGLVHEWLLALEEHRHGRRGAYRMIIHDVEPGVRIDYSIGAACRGSYLTLPHCANASCPETILTATLRLGYRLPVLDRFLRPEVARVRRQMWDDGQHLKAALASH